MPKRKEAEAFILKYIDALAPGNQNTEYYKTKFAGMSDKDFDGWMKQLNSGEAILDFIAPNAVKPALNVNRNIQIGKELGHSFFERIWMGGDGETPPYLTPLKYMVVRLPLRRQAQLLIKKISIPENNKSVDNLTGQPTGKSKGGAISYPETQVLAALNLDRNIVEMIKYRGGDSRGFNAMNDSVSKTGSVSQDAIEPMAGKVRATETLHAILTAMHLKNTL